MDKTLTITTANPKLIDANENANVDAEALLKTSNATSNDAQPLKDPQELERKYQAYNQESCLKYVRSFFNQHLDDKWFRERYSPLEYKRKVQSYKERAAFEAMAFLNEVQSSLQALVLSSAKSNSNTNTNRKVKEEDQGIGTMTALETKNDVPSFVINARLGDGIKPTNDSRDGHAHSHSANKRKYSSTSDTPHYDLISSYGLPKSHLFSFLHENTALHIMDIPSYVNEEHLMLAIKEQITTRKGARTAGDGNGNGGDNGDGDGNSDADLLPTTIICGEVVHGVCDSVRKSMERKDEFDMDVDVNNANGERGQDNAPVRPKFNESYQRSAWAIFPSAAAKEKVLGTIIGTYMDSDRGRHARDSRSTPKVIELTVDCSDPYGRYDVDGDAKGGEPVHASALASTAASVGMQGAKGADVNGIATANTNTNVDSNANGTNDGDSARIPTRRVSVFVSTSSPLKSQSTTVLSAAVSSLSRIPADKDAAIKIARTMDIMKDIPAEARLDAILDTLFSSPGFSTNDNDNGSDNRGVPNDESTCDDMLDVTIAYLRRVHLFTFYNGCIAAENIGSCLTSGNPTSVIHKRLKRADEILQKAREENADMYDDLPIREKAASDSAGMKEGVNGEKQANLNEPKDMLVMRLDDSIEKILGDLPPDLNYTSPFVVNEFIDAVASEVESLEEKTKKEWVHNHTVVDGDGRARCSFHSCRKLFKDEAFLKKHLLKKHGEHLQAELAKCHDVYMMKWWDEEEFRPVPSILVDCGSKFGLVPKHVMGAVKPCVLDPEPKLWREEDERVCREKEEDQRHREYKSSSVEIPNHSENYKKDEEQGAGNQEHFVDIDDMKDEKVELSFTNIENVQPPKKKKRKKRKLL